jgi:hypothetical protein
MMPYFAKLWSQLFCFILWNNFTMKLGGSLGKVPQKLRKNLIYFGLLVLFKITIYTESIESEIY